MKNSLRVLRTAKGLSQAELGKLAGYSNKAISLYEKSERPLSKTFLDKAAKALGVSIEQISESPELMHEDEPPFRPMMLNLETVSGRLLDGLLEDYAARVARADEPERSRLAQAIVMVTGEQRRRSGSISSAKGGDQAAAEAVVEELVRTAEGGKAKPRARKGATPKAGVAGGKDL